MISNITFNILTPDEKTIEYMEKMRFEAHNIPVDFPISNTYYAVMLRQHQMLMFAILVNKIPVAGAYVSCHNHSIFIEHLFVKQGLQKTTHHFGSNLIKYIISNKKALEEYYHTFINSVRIEYINNETKHIYEQLHFKESKIPGQLHKGI